jgi:hypothetical protein
MQTNLKFSIISFIIIGRPGGSVELKKKEKEKRRGLNM